MEARRYEFIFKKEGAEDNKTPIAKTGDGSSSGVSQVSSQGKNVSAKALAGALITYGVVKSFATQIVNHEISMVQLRTGSNELQLRANFYNKAVQTGVGVIESMALGKGLAGGVGSVLGLVITAGNKALTFYQNVQRLATARTVENVGLLMQSVRAGADGSRRK